ncbi:MAG: CapA family protein [Chloroflexi bacterium]|nr:CapA family protein [Chloroflexota bacterium]
MASNTVTMTLVGDIYLGGDLDPASLFAPTGTHVSGADITFGNLEASVSDIGAPDPNRVALVRGRVAFRSEPRFLAALTAGGFNAVGLANNHSLDYGAEAIMDTMQRLDAAGIAHAGAGGNISEAHEPAIVAAKGVKVAFLSYTSVFLPAWAAEKDRAGLAVVRVATAYRPPSRVFEQPVSPPIIVTVPDDADVEMARQDIKKARKRADVVVVSWHWGLSEGIRVLAPYQLRLGHAAIDAGADLVLGHHPHVPQAIEVYRGKVICYSMGNFFFPYERPFFDKDAFILKCRIEGKRLKRVSFLPILSNQQCQPQVLDLKRGRSIVEKIRNLSAPFGTILTEPEEEVVIGPPS